MLRDGCNLVCEWNPALAMNANEWHGNKQPPHCETDITLWSLLIKATMTFKVESEFD